MHGGGKLGEDMAEPKPIRVPKPRRRRMRVWPSRLPSVPAREEPREGILLPWLMATGGGALTLLLVAMALVKPLGVLPFEYYPLVVNCIAWGATVVALTGCVVALVRWVQHRRRHAAHRR